MEAEKQAFKTTTNTAAALELTQQPGLKGNLLYAQSGGPTAVINTSALGVFKTALGEKAIDKVYAAYHGIAGLLKEDIIDIAKESMTELEKLRQTPSALLGSCRYKLKDPAVDAAEYAQILAIFRKYNIRYFLYNGGNDSMDTCYKLSQFCKQAEYDCYVIGIPKTIDNDLMATDHSPGFGSTAKFIATMVAEIGIDASCYERPQAIVFEIMGRNAGWLAASAALAELCGFGPDLIYLPEVDFDLAQFKSDVKALYQRKRHIMIAVSEGVHLADGSPLGCVTADGKDAFGHLQLGGVGAFLAEQIKEILDIKVRAIEFSLLQRCAAHCASERDLQEAYDCGVAAVQAALKGLSGYMVALKRLQNAPYRAETILVDLAEVANSEYKVPRAWINAAGNGVTQALVDYVLPLTGAVTETDAKLQANWQTLERAGLPAFAKLNLARVQK